MNIKLDISEAVALICFMGDAIHAKEQDSTSDKEILNLEKHLFNGIVCQVNLELPPGDEWYPSYAVE